MKKLLGIFSTKDKTAEQIYEETMRTLQEKERLELLEMIKNRGKRKIKGK